MPILDNFKVIMLDMGDTFMFDCDRFGNIDEVQKIINYKRYNIDLYEAYKNINHIFNEMLRIARNEKYYENFPGIMEFINNDILIKSLCGNDKLIIEDIFSLLEIGTIKDQYINIIKSLSEKFKLGLISNVWSRSHYFINYFKSLDIFKYFQSTIFSSDYRIIKPAKKLFEIALQNFNHEKSEIVYIGNNYKRDVIGAKQSGLYSILINNGKASEINGSIMPDKIINDLEELLIEL